MMIADNKINAMVLGVLNLIYGLDPAIQCDDQGRSRFPRIIYPLCGNPVTFIVAVGDIKINGFVKGSQEGVDQGNRSSTVYIIIPVDKDLFLFLYSSPYPFNSYFHIFHQERIMEQ